MTDISNNYQRLRQTMVERDIKARGVSDKRVLEALSNVERHRFVLEKDLARAYADRPLPITEGQTISQPYIVAYMTEGLGLSATDKVLEIGTGSGYQAAVLAELCAQVYTIEIVEVLGNHSATLLASLGYDNIHVKIDDGFQGWKEHAPFDAIIVTSSPSQIPEPLKEQLAEGGRMIIPVGSQIHQQLIYLRKVGDKLIEEKRLPVIFVPMVDSGGSRY